MSQDTDRIHVPTNGRGPHLEDDGTAAGAAATGRTDGPPGVPVPRDQTVPLTPTQLAAGFGIVAGLLLLFVGARRRRGRSGDEP